MGAGAIAAIGRRKARRQCHYCGDGRSGQAHADALDTFDISYRALEVNHDCFVDACADGYAVGFGDATDLRLMDTIRMSHAEHIAITFADYPIARELAPIVQERYPDLGLIVAVRDEEDKKRFDALGMQAVIQQSFPRGIDLAAQLLEVNDISIKDVNKWMKYQQNYELDMQDSTHLAINGH